MKPKQYRKKLRYPCSESDFEPIAKILGKLRPIPDEFLVVDLVNYGNHLDFIQTLNDEEGRGFLVELGYLLPREGGGDDEIRIYQKAWLTREETTAIFREVCMTEAYDRSGWEDVTEEVFPQIEVNVCKESYKTVRPGSAEIHRGFGFRHLSDATQYYVHPNNQSPTGATTLCQPIGEALMLFALLLRSVHEGNPIGDFYVNEEKKRTYVELRIPQEYRDGGVTEPELYAYRMEQELGTSIHFGAYDAAGKLLPGKLEDVTLHYALLAVFVTMACTETAFNPDWGRMAEDFAEHPAADTFVNLHEDLYQNHKTQTYSINYTDIDEEDKIGMQSYSESYSVIRENKLAAGKAYDQPLCPFPADAFTAEQKRMIPQLGAEFALPEKLVSICNAVSAGDALSLLFHGPAGTGKTISCKLVAQAIGLPIFEVINCTENLDEFVLGKYVPEDDRIVFRESYVTRAIREGGAVVFEEINFAKPQYLAFLNSLLDDNGFVRLDNGDVVRRHPNFRFFATMNLGYFGTKELNQALYNRFNTIVELTELSDEAITRMLKTRVPECKAVVGKILGVYHKIRKKIESEELDIVISPRNLENWARLAKYEGYVNAAEKTIVPVAKCDRAMEEAIRGIILLYKWQK